MPLRHDLRWFVGSFGGGIGFLLGGFVDFCGVVEAQPISGEAKLAPVVLSEACRELRYAVGSGTQLGLDS